MTNSGRLNTLTAFIFEKSSASRLSENYIHLYVNYRVTEKHVRDFLNGAGPKLQEELIVHDKNNKHTSYNAGKIVALKQINLPKAHFKNESLTFKSA